MIVSSHLPRVAIVGRPNVGKSSLFNRIVGERLAIIEDEPGTTRDRLEAEVEWRERTFLLLDTGGFQVEDEGDYTDLIRAQIDAAIDEATLVLFCVDARDGLTASDYDVADAVRRGQTPVILVATKADNESREVVAAAEAGTLGFGPPLPVSALHDLNVGLLLDEVVKHLPETPPLVEQDRIRVAIVGRPNVGKSTLVNSLIGERRVIVSEIAGTTRDAIDTHLEAPEGAFTLIDTAGIRRPGKRGQGVERHAVLRATAALARCDVAVLLIDGSQGVTSQDTHIAGLAQEEATGIVIAVNKTDLWETPEEDRIRLLANMRQRFRFLPWAMFAFVSAGEAEGLPDLLRLVAEAREARRRRISTGELNGICRRALREHAPPVVHSKRLKIRYVTQPSVDPPTFVVFVNDPKLIHFSYRRYLERCLREAHDFEGTAIRFAFRSGNEEDANT
ncbi:MAG: ribosome biogenesis GTPase Der [Dehalococcoidia bacterium]|nr:ribosome biogenesis GTPase Der [Dehalococcoidia bacterium]